MAQVKFYTGTYETYQSSSKNPNALYFITDTLQLYKGSQLYTSNFQVVSNPPTSGIPGILYVSRNTHQLYVANDGGGVEALTPPITEEVKNGSKDLVTSGGVYTAIQAIITTADTLETKVNGFNDRISDLETALGIDPDNPPVEPDPENPDQPVTPPPTIPERLDTTEQKVEKLETQAAEDKQKITDLENNAIQKDETGVVQGNIKVSGTPTADNDVATKKYVDDKVVEVTEAIGGLDQTTIDAIKDVTDWINDPSGGAGALTADVADLKANAVRKEEGKGLSSNDFTDEYKKTLDDLKAGTGTVGGGLSGVKVNGTALEVAEDKTVNLVIGTGTGNGNIVVNGTQVKVSGLKSAAYKEDTEFATAAQGAKADTALQEASIAAGETYGTLKIGSKTVAIPGLGTAAYKDANTFVDATKLGDLGSSGTIADYAANAATTAKNEAIAEAQRMINESFAWEPMA